MIKITSRSPGLCRQGSVPGVDGASLKRTMYIRGCCLTKTDEQKTGKRRRKVQNVEPKPNSFRFEPIMQGCRKEGAVRFGLVPNE